MLVIILCQIFRHHEIHHQSLHLYFYELLVHKIGTILATNFKSYDGVIKIAKKRSGLD